MTFKILNNQQSINQDRGNHISEYLNFKLYRGGCGGRGGCGMFPDSNPLHQILILPSTGSTNQVQPIRCNQSGATNQVQPIRCNMVQLKTKQIQIIFITHLRGAPRCCCFFFYLLISYKLYGVSFKHIQTKSAFFTAVKNQQKIKLFGS